MRRPATSTIVAIGLVAFGTFMRYASYKGWIPLPPNVAPIAAMALLSGAVLPRRLTLVVPLSAMLVSDVLIGFYSLPVMIAVYSSFGILNVFSRRLQHRIQAKRVIGYSLAGSILFFLVTNASVWAFQNMYPLTIIGLMQSYTAGLPFFRNTILGDLFFTGILVGSYHLVMVYLARRRLAATLPIHG